MNTREKIPNPIISVVADVFAGDNGNGPSKADIENDFKYANAPGDMPDGGKKKMTMSWLEKINSDDSIQAPIHTLGLVLCKFMDAPNKNEYSEGREKISKVLSEHGLQYVNGGEIISTVGTPSRSLADFIKERNIPKLNFEFERALSKVESSPREAVSAASNILEVFCKAYIDAQKLCKPDNQDLQSIWKTVRKDLGFDPSQIEGDDLKKILSGLISIVDGVGALRTHASVAHGPGPDAYELESRHARLAIHAAHTVTYFLLEEWKNKRC